MRPGGEEVLLSHPCVALIAVLKPCMRFVLKAVCSCCEAEGAGKRIYLHWAPFVTSTLGNKRRDWPVLFIFWCWFFYIDHFDKSNKIIFGFLAACQSQCERVSQDALASFTPHCQDNSISSSQASTSESPKFNASLYQKECMYLNPVLWWCGGWSQFFMYLSSLLLRKQTAPSLFGVLRFPQRRWYAFCSRRFRPSFSSVFT